MTTKSRGSRVRETRRCNVDPRGVDAKTERPTEPKIRPPLNFRPPPPVLTEKDQTRDRDVTAKGESSSTKVGGKGESRLQ